MSILVAIVALILVVSIVALILALRKQPSSPGAVSRPTSNTAQAAQRPADPSRTLEEKLAVLKECGLELSPSFKVDGLLESMDREEYEGPGWDTILIGLGSEEEEEPFRNRCVNLWHFDTECIEDHGDYKRIAERMAEMAQGSLPLEDIKDYVDIDEEKAWVSFRIKGEDVKINCKVQDDWVDTDIFPKFAKLLEKSDPSKVFIYYDLGGQDCIIGCVSKEQLKRLNEYGIAFKPIV